MTDGVGLLMAMTYKLKAAGFWRGERQTNRSRRRRAILRRLRCADGKWLAVGALEPQFFAALIDKLGLEAAAFVDRWDRRAWPAMRARLEAAFARRTRDEWTALFADATPASRRCSTSTRRRASAQRRAPAFVESTARRNPRLRRASRARRPKSPGPRPRRAQTGRPSCAKADSPTNGSKRCAAVARYSAA